MTKQRFYLGFAAALALLFSACHDSIFETIDEEIEVDDSGITGTASSIVEFQDYLYLSAGHAGEIYRKPSGGLSRKAWTSLSVLDSKHYPIYLGVEGSTLYMIAYTYEDDDGYNVPTYYEYSTTNLSSWNGPQKIATDTSISNFSSTPLHSGSNVYIDNCIKVKASNNYTYSITGGDGDTKIYRDGTEILDTSGSDTGRIWAISATKDYLVIGANQGLYRIKINDDGSLGNPSESFTGEGAKSIFGGFRCFVVYIPEAFRGNNEGNAPIYVYKDSRGASYTKKEGLYAFYPGSGWDRDGTNSSSGN